jgi:hypothetical protein
LLETVSEKKLEDALHQIRMWKETEPIKVHNSVTTIVPKIL